jgi:hypothetical protein
LDIFALKIIQFSSIPVSLLFPQKEGLFAFESSGKLNTFKNLNPHQEMNKQCRYPFNSINELPFLQAIYSSQSDGYYYQAGILPRLLILMYVHMQNGAYESRLYCRHDDSRV